MIGTRQRRKDYGDSFRLDCTYCHKKTSWRLITSSQWFTFFAIPIVHYRISYLWVCPVCQKEEKITKQQFDNLRRTKQTFDAIKMELS